MVDKRRGEEIDGSLPQGKDNGREALDRYGQILARDPSSLVFAALAEMYRKRGMLHQAIATCRKGLRLHPGFMSGRVALARAYADSGKTKLAQLELEKVVQAAPDNLVAQKLLVEIYKKNGQLDLLEKTYHLILALDAADADARQGLERIREQREREQGTREAGPPEGEILTRTLAEIYAAQGFFDKAFHIYDMLSRQEPGDPLLHERLADLKGRLLPRLARARGRPQDGADDDPDGGPGDES